MKPDFWYTRISCCVVFICTGFAARAVKAADLGVIQITPLTTTEQGTSFELGDVPQGEFTGVHEVIETQALQQSGKSLAEVVAESGGVQFRQSGGIGSFSTISLRGSSAEQVNVYLDGILLNEAAGGGVNLSHIELMQADRVEVYRGAVPVQLGNSAIGGAVNITSNRATAVPTVRMLAGAGSFGSAKVSASYAGPLDWLNEQRLIASFSHRQSDNDFSFVNDNGTSFNLDDDQVQQRNNAATRSTSGFLKSGFAVSATKRLEQAIQIETHYQGIADWRNTRQGNATLDTDSLQWRSTLSDSANKDGWSSKWDVHYSAKDEVFDDTNASIGLGVRKILSSTRVIGAQGYWEKLGDNRSLSLNIKARHETLDTSNQFNDASHTAASRSNADIGLQWNRYYDQGNSLFSAGLGGFVVRDDFDTQNADIIRERYSDDSIQPRLGVNHYLGNTFGGSAKIIANASLQKRVPSFFELFGNQGFFQGNPNLVAERSVNLDLGMQWQSDTSDSIDTTVQLVWFYNRKKDLISRVYDSRGVGRAENISAARVSGLELAGKFDFGNGLSIKADITVQDAKNLSLIRGNNGRQLPGEAAVDGLLALSWKNAQWNMEYAYKVNNDRYYDSPNLLPAVDQRIHSVSVSREFQHWRIAAEINNLGNRNYEDFNGYPKPGRSGFINFLYQP